MEIEQIIDTERRIEEETDPLIAPLAVNQVNSIPIRVFLVLTAVTVIGITLTAGSDTDVIYLLICYHEGIDADSCFKSPRAGELASSITLYANLVVSLGGIFVTPMLTSLSDRIGRKPVFIYSATMTLLGQFIQWWLMFGTTASPHYMWILASLLVTSLGGGTGLCAPLTVSYVSDTILDSDERTRYISFIDGTIYIAVALGPAFGSMVYNMYGLESTYKVAMGVVLSAAISAFFLVSESVSQERQLANRSSTKIGLIESCKMLTYTHILDAQRRKTVRLFTVCSMFGTEVTMAVFSVLFLYTKTRFNWTAGQLGYFITGASGERFVALMFGFPAYFKMLSTWWPTKRDNVDRVDVTLLRTALGLSAVGFFFMMLAPTSATFVLSVFVEGASGLGNPVYRSALLKYAPEGQFGAFLGSISLVNSAMALIFPTILLKIYSMTLESWPGLVFLVAALAFFMLVGVSFLIRPKV